MYACVLIRVWLARVYSTGESGGKASSVFLKIVRPFCRVPSPKSKKTFFRQSSGMHVRSINNFSIFPRQFATTVQRHSVDRPNRTVSDFQPFENETRSRSPLTNLSTLNFGRIHPLGPGVSGQAYVHVCARRFGDKPSRTYFMIIGVGHCSKG